MPSVRTCPGVVSFLLYMAIFVRTFSQNQSASRLAASQQIDAFIQNKLQTIHIPGLSLTVVADGKIIYTKGYGFANLEHQIPSKPETNYLIASVTKSITGVALMMLWKEGKFTLEDSIGQYLEDLPAHWNPLTIRRILVLKLSNEIAAFYF